MRSAGRLSDDSRTLLVEMEIDSAQSKIMAGSFAHARFISANRNTATTLPASALLFRADGPQVAVVLADNKVEMRNVKLGRDFGKTVEVLSGVGSTDRVIVSPSDALVSGATVRIAEDTKVEQNK
jgi:multidrug efflux pump subunit AcrA (membrane-fusion protein)